MTDTVPVRIVGTTRAQLVSFASVVAVIGVLVIVQRRKTLLPLAATRCARKLRTIAQRIEDAGLDIARTHREDTAP